MDKSNITLEEIKVKYDQFLTLSKTMYQTMDLLALRQMILDLEGVFDELIIGLNLFRKEQPKVVVQVHKEILLNISKKNQTIHENLERLDTNYNYEQGVLEEYED